MTINNSDLSLLVFDLDGTLVESHDTIYNATVETLKKIGIQNEIDYHKFKSMIGHHFKDIFDAFGIRIDDLDNYLKIYKSFYFENMIHSKLYPNTVKTLEYFSKSKKIALLTTKMQEQAEKILFHFNIAEYFDLISGRKDGMPVKPAAEPLLEICTKLNILPHNTMMVGDSDLDIQCGKNAGTKTCAVSFGYRTKEFLISENPDILIDDLNELLKYLK